MVVLLASAVGRLILTKFCAAAVEYCRFCLPETRNQGAVARRCEALGPCLGAGGGSAVAGEYPAVCTYVGEPRCAGLDESVPLFLLATSTQGLSCAALPE